MIGDQTKRMLTVGFILVIALIGGGLLVWRGRQGATPPTPVTVTVEAVKSPVEAADLQPTRTPEPTVTKKPEDFISAADAGLPAGYQPLGAPGGRQIKNISEITPQAPPTKAPVLQSPGEGEPVDVQRLAEGVRKAADQAKGLTERLTGPTPTPTPQPGMVERATSWLPNVPKWLWVILVLTIVIALAIVTGFVGIEHE